ncbi:MAG: YidC/Oxa1 family membrane protein insertase [Clostridiales bacterium]|nr:YidC/Oxa1 family membrane protein insertase [Clostridiales bacterium]
MGFLSVFLLSNPLNALNGLFGWITKIFYNYFGNYGLAIIALTILIRVCMIPLNISSQRSMIKSKTMSSKMDEIKRKYPNDKQKQQEEQTKLMQENGASGFSGCLLSILQLFFIWPIFRIVSGPLHYICGVSEENIERIGTIAFNKGALSEKVLDRISTDNVPLIRILNENSDVLKTAVDGGFIKTSQVLDLHFLGFDLTDTPQWLPTRIMADPKRYLPLLLIPILVTVTSIISMQLTNVLNPDYKEKKEQKKRAKKNAAMAGQAPTDQSEMMTKMMAIMMPLLMIVTSFTMPAAMGLYWIVGGIMSIITQVIVYYLFTKPYALKKKELDAQKEAFLRSNKSGANKNGEKKNNKKNDKKNNNYKNKK